MLVRRLIAVSLLLLGCTAQGAEHFWLERAQEKLQTFPMGAANADAVANAVAVTKGTQLYLDHQRLVQWSASHKTLELTVPLPDGSFRNFTLTPNTTLSPALAAKYPQLHTYQGVDVENPANRGSFEITPQGFSGFFYVNGNRVLLSPMAPGNSSHHISHFRIDAGLPKSLRDEFRPLVQSAQQKTKVVSGRTPVTDGSFRRYRLAMAANSRFASEVGNSNVNDTMAVITTLVNRINEIFRSEAGIEFQLIANNDELVFVDPASDPFSGDSAATDIEGFTAVFNDAIGVANYDVGHLLNVQSGGLASNGVCLTDFKMRAYTGLIPGTSANESFVIDLLAHEMGHQFSAFHTFNGLAGTCGQNGQRTGESAWEPGSGSTIMAYAGICPFSFQTSANSQNLQGSSDAFFHIGSLEQMREDVENPAAFASRCGTDINTSNRIPTVDAGADFTIPANTPFSLSGSGEDPDGDSLTYIWEQLDPGGETSASRNPEEMIDDGIRPLFRSFTPQAQPVRFLPRYAAVLDGSADLGNGAPLPFVPSSDVAGETYPTEDRTLNFRLTARDGNGGVATDAMVVTTVDTGSRFAITAPEAGASLTANAAVTVRWEVAGTAQAPISCGQVDIGVSYDGGSVFRLQSDNTENDGEESFLLPGDTSDDVRFLITCEDNIFYAVSPGKQIVEGINQAPSAVNDAVTLEQDSPAVLIDVLANDSDDRDATLTLVSINYDGNGSASIVDNQIQYQPAAAFNGEESLSYVVEDSDGLSATGTLAITVNAPAPPPTPTPAPTADSGGGGGAPWLLLGLIVIAIGRRVRRA